MTKILLNLTSESSRLKLAAQFYRQNTVHIFYVYLRPQEHVRSIYRTRIRLNTMEHAEHSLAQDPSRFLLTNPLYLYLKVQERMEIAFKALLSRKSATFLLTLIIIHEHNFLNIQSAFVYQYLNSYCCLLGCDEHALQLSSCRNWDDCRELFERIT